MKVGLILKVILNSAEKTIPALGLHGNTFTCRSSTEHDKFRIIYPHLNLLAMPVKQTSTQGTCTILTVFSLIFRLSLDNKFLQKSCIRNIICRFLSTVMCWTFIWQPNRKISSAFVITIWSKVILHHKMHFNAFTILFYKSYVTEIKFVISYHFVCTKYEYDIEIAKLVLVFINYNLKEIHFISQNAF